jgi:protein-S-isoprenylcysteine O-methyltransferase Ste14
MAHLAGSFIGLCWGLMLAVIAVSAFSVKRTIAVDRRWRWSALALVVGAALLLRFVHAIPGPASALATPLWPRTPIIEGGADLIVLVGLAIALWGRATLGRNWNIDPGLKENHELIARGPYAYVRHPMYSGLIIMLLGTVMWFGTATGLVFFLACFAGTWLKLRQEEILLTRHFGALYPRYQARVKALIPFVL